MSDAYQRAASNADVRQRMAHAIGLHRAGRLAEAEAIYRFVLDVMPGHFDALHNVAVLFLQRGDHVAALDMLRRALSINPNSAALHLNIGNALREAGELEEALESYDRALSLKSAFAEAHNNRATVLRNLNRDEEAVTSADRAIALNCRYKEAHLNRGHALDTLKRYEEAIISYRDAAACGADAREVDYYLAALGAAPAPAASPRTYVTGLFDSYAEWFDRSLLGLGYDIPRQLVEAVRAVRPRGATDVADLGCGTGLCGMALRSIAGNLVGLDISAKMIAKAAERGVYDGLAQTELLDFLRGTPDAWDLIVAADVLVYVGDLNPVLGAARSALREGGHFAYSVEAHDGDGYVLRPTRRFAHSAGYLRGLSDTHGFIERSVAPVIVRSEGGRDIRGFIVVLERT
jgi:predicted TPR repeat methyltransferase